MSLSKTSLSTALCTLLLCATSMTAQNNNVNVVNIVNTGQTPTLIVPDTDNNRVLIYNYPFTTNKAASTVLGQSSFTTATSGTTPQTMYWPSSVATDSSGNIFVSDNSNCRVTQFLAPFTNGEAAVLAIGKPDLYTGCTFNAPTQNNVGQTSGVATDLFGNLWVADAQNNRVLRFSRPFYSGMPANLVLGQSNFTSGLCNRNSVSGTAPTAATLCAPAGVAVDYSGNLWVADSTNHRVLEFRPPFTTGMNASVEFGHPAATAFTSNFSNDDGPSAKSLNSPTGIGTDIFGRVWVADTMNNRVLRFDPPYQNGKSASLVLGQPDFIQTYQNITNASTMTRPEGIALNLLGVGGVFVGDTGNNRTLLFAGTSNGQAASVVIGQTDFAQFSPNKGNSNPDATTQFEPFHTAGPSLLALGVLGGLAGIRRIAQRKKK